MEGEATAPEGMLHCAAWPGFSNSIRGRLVQYAYVVQLRHYLHTESRPTREPVARRIIEVWVAEPYSIETSCFSLSTGALIERNTARSAGKEAGHSAPAE